MDAILYDLKLNIEIFMMQNILELDDKPAGKLRLFLLLICSLAGGL